MSVQEDPGVVWDSIVLLIAPDMKFISSYLILNSTCFQVYCNLINLVEPTACLYWPIPGGQLGISWVQNLIDSDQQSLI